MTHSLAPDKASAEVLKDSLLDLKDNKAYQLVVARLDFLLQRDLRLLEAELDPLLLRHLQGRVKGMREAMGVVDDIVRELNNTDFTLESSSGTDG